jgi:hypothetical protein
VDQPSSPRIHVKFDLPVPSTDADLFQLIRMNDSPLQLLNIEEVKGSPREHVKFDYPPPSTDAEQFQLVRMNDVPTPIPPVIAFNGSPREHVKFDYPPPSTDVDYFQVIRLNDSPTPIPPIVGFQGSPRTFVKFDYPPPTSLVNLNSIISSWVGPPPQIFDYPQLIQIVAFVPSLPPAFSWAAMNGIIGWWNMPPPMPLTGLQTTPRIHTKFDLPPVSTVWPQGALLVQTWLPPPPSPPIVGFKGSPRVFVAFDYPTPSTDVDYFQLIRLNDLPTPIPPIVGFCGSPRTFVAFDYPPPSTDVEQFQLVRMNDSPVPVPPVTAPNRSPRVFVSFDVPPPSSAVNMLSNVLAGWNIQAPPQIQRVLWPQGTIIIVPPVLLSLAVRLAQIVGSWNQDPTIAGSTKTTPGAYPGYNSPPKGITAQLHRIIQAWLPQEIQIQGQRFLVQGPPAVIAGIPVYNYREIALHGRATTRVTGATTDPSDANFIEHLLSVLSTKKGKVT